MATFTVKKGERQRVLHLVSDSMPQQVRFSAAPVGGPGDVRGRVEVIGSRWLFRKPIVTADLAAENAFRKGMWDSRYEIWVTPEQDTAITFTTSHFRSKYLIFAIGLVIVLAVASVAVMAIIRAGGS